MTGPARVRRDHCFMVTHVAYDPVQCRTARDCVETIRNYVELGWKVTQVRGPKDGPFYVVFRKDGEAQ